jgi:hypothetical protein
MKDSVCQRCGGVYTKEHRCSVQVQEYDVVKRPAHYNQGDIECIDAIRAQLSDEEWRGYLRGQVAKYNWRLGHKDDPVQDARKLNWYATWLTGEDPRA